ncbi:alpha-1-antitrypsin 1-6 [Phodopus roborovskii]|uniref:Serpina1f protein n=1 Tax=Phodopus roborovskii TaxID=109678 RepID=A0AAU9ZU20_PHORO|nr:alpha-1-antitrypsin 1-6 [Phodopus roborovskii]CAH6850336.1 Serpina1f [Phodopus roborovskii]
MMTPFFSHGFLLLVGLCYLLPGTQATYEGLYNDSGINRFHCRKVALTVSNVSISLYKQMAQKSRSGNILFSPIRVVASILMLSLGAKGKVSQHILEALKLNKTGLPEAEIHRCFQYLLHAINQATEVTSLKSGNSMFIHQDLKLVDKSLETIKDLYFSEVIPTNFRDSNRAKAQINNYMMKKTNKEIVDMVNELKNDTFLALMDYIVWNGKIISNFYCQFIKMEDFYLGRKQTMNLPTVNNVGVYHLFQVSNLSSTVLVHSNGQGSVIAYFIIPDNIKLHQLEQRLTYPHFRQMIQKFSLRMVKVHIPILSLSETYDVESVMDLLGITPVFNEEANSSEIMQNTPQKSFKVLSKAMLTLDDKGTNPTKGPCLGQKQWSDLPLVKLNRPFLIFIQDLTNNIPLLLGRVVDPRK